MPGGGGRVPGGCAKCVWVISAALLPHGQPLGVRTVEPGGLWVHPGTVEPGCSSLRFAAWFAALFAACCRAGRRVLARCDAAPLPKPHTSDQRFSAPRVDVHATLQHLGYFGGASIRRPECMIAVGRS